MILFPFWKFTPKKPHCSCFLFQLPPRSQLYLTALAAHGPRTNHLAFFGVKNPHSISSAYVKDTVYTLVHPQHAPPCICIYISV